MDLPRTGSKFRGDSGNRLPCDVLQVIGSLLNEKDLAAARRVCSAWRQGISWAVTHLRLRVAACASKPGPFEGQPSLLTSFPNVKVLDLRRTSLCPDLLTQLQPLVANIPLLQVAYHGQQRQPLECSVCLPRLYHSLTELAKCSEVEVEIHLEYSPTKSHTFTDTDLASIAAIPPSVCMTLLHIDFEFGDDIEDPSLLFQLTTLRELDLVTLRPVHSARQSALRQLSQLTNLTQLRFGVIASADESSYLMEGLAGCAPHLQKLCLESGVALMNSDVEQLAALLPRLTQLKLINVPWLTDSCVRRGLIKFSCLTGLCLTDNSQISCRERGLQLLRRLPSLRELDILRFPRVGPEDVELLLSFTGMDRVNDRCKNRRRHGDQYRDAGYMSSAADICEPTDTDSNTEQTDGISNFR